MSELGSLIEVLGVDTTLKLVEAYGGTRRGVPKVKPEKHELRDLLGDVGFTLLYEYFGGDEIDVPLAKRWRLEIYKKRGLKTREIALRAGYSERSVARILNGNGNMDRQLSLALDMPSR